MTKRLHLISIATLCLALLGCYEPLPPISSASVTFWQGGKPQAEAQPLTPQQVANLSAWLKDHRDGWGPVLATYAPAILLSVTHEDGSMSSANLMKTVLVVDQHQRSLSESESLALHAIVGPRKDG